MSENGTPQARRPELLATLLRVDLTDGNYAALARLGARIGLLLSDSTAKAKPEVVSSLDDLLGAIYALFLARHHHFEDRLDRDIEIPVVCTRAEQVARGDIRVDGKWIAGWHFNSALFRVAAVYHRLLKVAAGDPQTEEYRPKLLPKVRELYRAWSGTDWSSQNADAIYAEVNILKHAPEGVHHGRRATFNQAVSAVGELLTLIEAWRINAQKQRPSVQQSEAPPNSP